jgi:phosphatidate cytidylyltransferase
MIGVMADPTHSFPPSKSLVFARRLGSTLLLWCLVSWVFYSRHTLGFLGLIALLTVLGSVEYFRMLRVSGVKCFPRFGILLSAAYCGMLHSAYFSGTEPLPFLDTLAVFIAITGAFTLQLRHPIKGIDPLVAVATTVLGFIYVPFLFNFATRLVFLTPSLVPGKVSDSGAFILLWLIAVTKFSDMGAYMTGTLIGRHKMIPHVSPAKTWEGIGGALLFSQLAACGLFALFPTALTILGGWKHVIILGFGLSILAVVGDLAESIVKRALSAKDSGQMLPGIGGALDLIDSLCFTAPALYFYLLWLMPPQT